jgi:hypothetical protein
MFLIRLALHFFGLAGSTSVHFLIFGFGWSGRVLGLVDGCIGLSMLKVNIEEKEDFS